MESFIKNIKKKLSVDNIVDMMKDSEVIDENAIKEEDVRKTLQKIDPNTLMDVDELAAKLNEISDEMNNSKSESSSPKKTGEPIKEVLSKPMTQDGNQSSDNEFLRALNREENVFHLNDDFP